MKLKFTSIFVVLSSVILLSACSGKKAMMAQSASSDSMPQSSYADANANVAAETYRAAQQVSYKKDADGFMLNPMQAPANQTYYFSFDNSEMRSQDMKALLTQANYLASHPGVAIRLEGNTDNRGSREYNIGLGWRRDQTVARLLEQQGVNPSQIQMVSYGKQNPVLNQNNDKAWALNRRVVMIYKKTRA